MYNLGFAIFTVGSILLSLTWGTGSAGATQLIIFRVIQGIGGALLMANSTAILTDAFPVEQRGMAMGINMIAAIVGLHPDTVIVFGDAPPQVLRLKLAGNGSAR